MLVNLAGVYFASGGQCPFGKMDSVNGELVKKHTGYLTNSQVTLNKIALPCRCPPGAHQGLEGGNSQGVRTAQAAAYPPALAEAVCQGARRQMKIDYVGEGRRGVGLTGQRGCSPAGLSTEEEKTRSTSSTEASQG